MQNKQSLTVNYFLRLLVPIIVLCVGGAIALFLLPSALTANAEKNLLAVLLLVIGAVTPPLVVGKSTCEPKSTGDCCAPICATV